MRPEQLTRVTNVLIMMMEDEGLLIDDVPTLRNFIYHAFNENRIKFFTVNGNPAGFAMWEALEFGDGWDITITHLVILPEFRHTGLVTRRQIDHLKNLYGKIYKIKWHHQKGKEFLKHALYLEDPALHKCTT